MDVVSATDPHIRKSIIEDPAAIIPIGSVEQHGPHLPVSTDSDIVGEGRSGWGSGLSFLEWPTYDGVSFEHAAFLTSAYGVRWETVLGSLCESIRVRHQGYYFDQWHYGNRDALIRFAQRRTDVLALLTGGLQNNI